FLQKHTGHLLWRGVYHLTEPPQCAHIHFVRVFPPGLHRGFWYPGSLGQRPILPFVHACAINNINQALRAFFFPVSYQVAFWHSASLLSHSLTRPPQPVNLLISFQVVLSERQRSS